jgi:cytochrome c oxidase accessory protein FixG
MKKSEEGGFRDHIATVNDKGKRVWIFPKKPSGTYYNYRKILSYFLLAFLFLAPHIKINGKQMLLFDIIDRKFIIFGNVFWPQDFWIFALVMVLGVVFIIFFTIIFGRLFCGWICPQTIFMEMVFRRIEYWIEGDYTHQKKLNEMPWNAEKIRKKTIKHILFWGLSFLIANTFLAYIIGSKQLWEIQTDPLNEHLSGFIVIIIFTTVFYFVFASLREQVCTTICPYGRLQGVLLDANTMVISYDHVRGEGENGRAKFRKNEDRQALGKGDCIDCNQCVVVCPTGIDIRNGTQLECVNCTACIDACDHMMESVGLPTGLISFKSENNIVQKEKFTFTPRVKAYTAVLTLLVGMVFAALLTRSDFQTTILRKSGTTYNVKDGQLKNTFNIILVNKTDKEYEVEIKFKDNPSIKIEQFNKLILPPEGQLQDSIYVFIPLKEVTGGKKIVNFEVYGNGKLIDDDHLKIIGPTF